MGDIEIDVIYEVTCERCRWSERVEERDGHATLGGAAAYRGARHESRCGGTVSITSTVERA